MIDRDSILYQDQDLIAIHKPAGLLVHRSMIDRHETRFAVQLVRDLIGQRVYPVHRLDKPTSGVLLFALNADVARHMCEVLATGGVQKRYFAVVRGYAIEQDVIVIPCWKNWMPLRTARRARIKHLSQRLPLISDWQQ